MQETDSQSQEQATATKAASAPAKSRTLWGDAFRKCVDIRRNTSGESGFLDDN